MRPRVHRHLVTQIRELALELRALPDHPILSESYQMARTIMRDQISLAMKYEMRANTFTGRALRPAQFDEAVNRKCAAKAWWGWRGAIRKARVYHSFARILLKFDQEIE